MDSRRPATSTGELIPVLAERYRVIAPDLPGFGSTRAPGRSSFDYTFERLADVIGAFTEALGLSRYALYVFDYGAPVGFRLAATMRRGSRMRGRRFTRTGRMIPEKTGMRYALC